MNPELAELAAGIRQLAKQVGRKQLAEWCGVKHQTVWKWWAQPPGGPCAKRLATVAAAQNNAALAAQLMAHHNDRLRARAKMRYAGRCNLFAATGKWPPEGEPTDPPEGANIEHALRCLEPRGYTIRAGRVVKML